MKRIIVVLMLMASPVLADSPDLGGVGTAVSKIALATRAGTGVALSKRVDGLLYVPWPALHSPDGKREYAVVGLGADLGVGSAGTKFHGSPLIAPMLNPVACTATIFERSSWAQAHLAFADVGNIDTGIGILPLPVPGSHGKWVIGNQVIGTATWRFGGVK